MAPRRAIWPGLALGLILLAAMPAAAQVPLPTPPQPDPLSARDSRRVNRMEQVMRELRAIVFQGRETGHPVVVQPAETEQQVSDMADRVTSLEQSLTRLNSQLETQGRGRNDGGIVPPGSGLPCGDPALPAAGVRSESRTAATKTPKRATGVPGRVFMMSPFFVAHCVFRGGAESGARDKIPMSSREGCRWPTDSARSCTTRSAGSYCATEPRWR